MESILELTPQILNKCLLTRDKECLLASLGALELGAEGGETSGSRVSIAIGSSIVDSGAGDARGASIGVNRSYILYIISIISLIFYLGYPLYILSFISILYIISIILCIYIIYYPSYPSYPLSPIYHILSILTHWPSSGCRRGVSDLDSESELAWVRYNWCYRLLCPWSCIGGIR
jgi:hypothetical protein